MGQAAAHDAGVLWIRRVQQKMRRIDKQGVIIIAN